MKLPWCIFSLFLSLTLQAQTNPGPRIAAIGLNGLTIQDVWCMQSNQAGLAALNRPTGAIAYERKYFNPELSVQSGVFAYPVGQHVFGISFQRDGFDVYSEQKVGVAYARKFGHHFFTALNINYHQLNINGYGSANTFSIEAGVQYQVSKQWLIGAHLNNPGRNGYHREIATSLPTTMAFGVSYSPASLLSVHATVVQAIDFDTDIRLGIEYFPISWFALRGGFSTAPNKHYAGFGISYGQITIDLAASSHPTLGYSPQIALNYVF